METNRTTKKLLRNQSLNQYFTTIALSILDGRTIDRNSQTKETISTHVFNMPHLREQDVYKALYTIDASKDIGSDGIPARALKIAALHISQVVTHFFNESFKQGIYPTSWKTAKVTPVFKGGKR